jgi:PAS domain S-box-containing protein
VGEDRSRGQEIDELRNRLAEAEATLRAIRQGEVDAIVVEADQGPTVYTLRTPDEPYRAFVEQMREGAAILDAQGYILFCNRQFAELVGAPSERVIGTALDRFVPQTERAAVEAMGRAAAGPYRGHLKTAGGTPVPVLLSFTRAQVDGVETQYLIANDLRDILGVQTALAQARAEAQAKDEFLAMLGHELRNPLGAIASAVGILNATGTTVDAVERARAVIGRQMDHLCRLVDDLLDVSRATTGKVMLVRRPLDLAALVRDLMASWRAMGRLERHQVTVETEPTWVNADETRIEQVVGNLVGNALKYTPEGGRVALRVAPRGEAALFEVSDTGVGIPPSLLDKVFDLFVQADRSLDRPQGGLGIGLTLVKALVQRHDGTVEVQSEGAGKGTVFTVRLPRIPAPAPRPDEGRPRSTRRAPSRRRVFVVEDNADAREMLRVALTLEGHEVHTAADGVTAVDLAVSVAPDVALIDLGLPGLDGYEVARRIRASDVGRSMRLVALTGYGQAEDRERALHAGFDAHLTKPVSPDQLSTAITEGVAGGGHDGSHGHHAA